MFVLVIDLNGIDRPRVGVCKFPEAYISKIRADYPDAECVWCFSFRTPQKARVAARFLRSLTLRDLNEWRKMRPEVITNWIKMAIQD